jgi:hypothetical protein
MEIIEMQKEAIRNLNKVPDETELTIKIQKTNRQQ